MVIDSSVLPVSGCIGMLEGFARTAGVDMLVQADLCCLQRQGGAGKAHFWLVF